MNNFKQFGFKQFLNIGLAKLNFIEPTIVQEKIITILLKHQNVICKAPTGTGKTFAFCLSILNNINFDQTNIQCIIATPTRELAKQIYNNFYFFKKFQPNLQVNYFIGGENIKHQIKKLHLIQPHIIIATPARLKELLNRQNIDLKKLTTFIIDECDMIFDLGFIENIDFILNKINYNVKISVFSATISHKLKIFLIKYLKNPYYLDLNVNKLTNQNITHILISTKHQKRQIILLKLLKIFTPYLCLIFINKKADINKYYNLLLENNYSVAQLHAGLRPRLRSQVIKRIRNSEYKYVIASDVVARGIDFIGVTHVVSIDLPNNLEYYIHRSGRTGRSNYSGYSYVLYDTKSLNLIQQLITKGIIFKINKWNKQGELVETVLNSAYTSKKQSFAIVDNEINKIINRYKTNNNSKIKPCYKKNAKQKLINLKKVHNSRVKSLTSIKNKKNKKNNLFYKY